MGESDRYVDYRQKKNMRLGDDRNALVTLFAINGILFLLLLLIQVSYSASERTGLDFYNEVLSRVALPQRFGDFIKQPWALLTYMFSHSGVSGTAMINFASSMLWLWAFGYLFQQLMGNGRLIPVYLYGGLLGGLLFMCSHLFISSLQDGNTFLIGANASILAIGTAATVTMPNYRFFQQLRGGIPLWVLMIAYLIIDLAGPLRMGNTGICIAHAGGALAGLLYVLLLRKGIDAGGWMHKVYDACMNLYQPHPRSKDKVKEKIFYETGGRKPFTKTAHITQQRVDEILDKINRKGYGNLTKEEKDILRKASEDENL